MSILELRKVSYEYEAGKSIFNDINLTFQEGMVYVILGASGSGKTTLLSLLGGLDSCTKGKILFKNKPISEIGVEKYRRNHISFVFQNYNLIEYMTAKENVELVSLQEPETALRRVGLSHEEIKRNVLKLSGGQQQRVAIARALASQASIILADEPTGNLDENTAMDIAQLLLDAAHVEQKCVIIVSHARELADLSDVVLRLSHGQIHIE